MQNYFAESKDELSYANLRLQPLIFKDAILRLSKSVYEAQSGNVKLEKVAETKLLDFNVKKSAVMIFGNKKGKADISNQLNSSPLTLCGKELNRSEHERYLGDYLSSGGLSDSVKITVDKRKGFVISNIYHIRQIIEDCRANVASGIIVGLEIWELAIIPYLLNDSETWINISNNSFDELDRLQTLFYRIIFATPRTCPTPALYWETGSMTMKHRIAKRKLASFKSVKNC